MATRFAGYAGRILDVDLTARTVRPYPVSDEMLERYVGGKTLAARILWDVVPPGIDPLSPENVLVFTTGPFTGSGAPAASRFNLSTKNVLTGGVCSSNCGGDFGLYLKRAGCDGLVIRGRAERPTWLAVDERGARFEDALHLWGLDVEQVQHRLPPKHGHVVIGPAGENLVRFACALSGERCLGRGGVGAVMGSKNLKVVTATGARRMTFHDKAAFRRVVAGWVKGLQEHSITGRQLPGFGTAGMVSGTNATGTLPTHNFGQGSWEHADDVSGERLAREHLVRNDGCSSCPIRCGRVVRREGREIKGPEFETVGMFGPNIENRSLPRILEWNWMCDVLGMDTISLGSTLATAMELKERGRMPELPVAFGQFDGMEDLLRDIAYRRGVGDELAEGGWRLAKRRGDPDLSMQAKGMEFAAYEPRRAVGHGLGYAVSNRGGCHLNGGYLIFFEALGPVNIDPQATESKPELVVFQQNLFEAMSACGGCIFPSYAVLPDLPAALANPHGTFARIANLVLKSSGGLLHGQGKLKAAWLPFHLPLVPHSRTLETLTGMPMSLGLFTALGERGYTLERLFNVREGLTAADDSLPPRLTDVPQRPDRPDWVVPLAKMLPVYYEVRDWDGRGVPSEALLRKLGLDFAMPVTAQAAADPASLRSRRERVFAGEDAVLRPQLAGARDWAARADADREALEAAARRAPRVAHAARVRVSSFSIDADRCRQCGLCHRACPVDAIAWERGAKARILPDRCIRCGACHDACPPHYDAVVLAPVAPADDRTAAIYRVIDDKCMKCGLCFKACPVDAIAWKRKELARIDPELCVACGRCHAACPPKWAAIEVL